MKQHHSIFPPAASLACALILMLAACTSDALDELPPAGTDPDARPLTITVSDGGMYATGQTRAQERGYSTVFTEGDRIGLYVVKDKTLEVENLCLKLLLQQQPVARDLRQISAALKMITDMERIGDQAEDIAEIITFLGGRGAENSNLLREMARSTIKMVTESVDAYVKHDTALADQVIAEDDTVDDYFARVKKDLIKRIAQDPDDGEFALDLLMIAKYFERIGDHATNIAEWVIFSVTGEHKEG